MPLRDLRPSVRRIRLDGDPAAATVTAVRPRGAGRLRLTLLVDLPGGREATVTRTTTTTVHGGVQVGDRVAVRYDRARPGRVELAPGDAR